MSLLHRKREVKRHRWDYYLNALDKLQEGKTTPNHVTLRWNKLKEIK